MRTFTARSTAPPAAAWALLARPARWPEWAPHLGGAWGLGEPEVRVGALVEMVHRVEPAPGGGCEVAIDVIAPGPLEGAVAAAYGPIIGATLRRLARRAE